MLEIDPENDVYRDEQGNPVTIDKQQLQAIFRALDVVGRLRLVDPRFEGKLMNSIDIRKSRLLGRMLLDGRPPLPEKPEEYLGAPGYHLVEPDLDHFYLGAGPHIMVVAPTETDNGTES